MREKVGNPLQTKQGNRPYFRDQEERKGSDEVVPGTHHCLARKIKFLFKPPSMFNKCFRCIEPCVRQEGIRPFSGSDTFINLTEYRKPGTWDAGQAIGKPGKPGGVSVF